MFTMRFDMRSAASGAPCADLYDAALQMCAFADGHAASIVVCEHHGSPDGYLPSPMPFAAAIAARTSKVPIRIALLLLPLYNPVRLAEEMCVLDTIARGRAHFVAGLGYRPEEYDMMGVDFTQRGRIMDENLAVLLRAKTGEPFDHEGRRIQVTPAPFTPGGPSLALGGQSPPAARRAGRNGLDMLAQTDDPRLLQVYLDASREAGREPGRVTLPPSDAPSQVFVADDVDAAWDELGPYMMNDVLPYAAWNEGKKSNNISSAGSPQALRAENRSHRVFTVEEAAAWIRSGKSLPLHPLIGGLSPEFAWPYLRRVVEQVLPLVRN